MRNPCVKAENKFIVLELCETVQPRQIVLGNFELFSSGPRDIRVLTAERSGADWQLLGNFTATDTRQLQTFNIESRQYAKLLKACLLFFRVIKNFLFLRLSCFLITAVNIIAHFPY